MKLRVRLTELSNVASAGPIPQSYRLSFGPNGQEDPQFVPVGATPGRRYPNIRLVVDQLVAEAIAGFQLGGEYLLTLEPVARR